jgi:subfamily B ATP-binding cassette protein HlyB/CyaB
MGATSVTLSPPADAAAATQIRALAVAAAARFHGVDLDGSALRAGDDGIAPPAALVAWARNGGLWARALRLRPAQVWAIDTKAPVVLLLRDGGAVLMVAADAARRLVAVRHSRLPAGAPPLVLDEVALSDLWDGETILLKAHTARAAAQDEPFGLGWVARLLRRESRAMRDLVLASAVLSVLTVLPPMITMTVIDQVVTHRHLSTLILASLLIGTAMLAETILGHVRRQMVQSVGARVDARLHLHVFERLLRLPLDFFERNQAGAVWSMTGPQLTRIREFLTGRLLTALLDTMTLLVLLPVLFWLQPVLTWMVLAAAGLIAAVIVGFMRPMRTRVQRWIAAETARSSVIVEMLHGIRTIKSLALEPHRADLWDSRVAEATDARLAAGRFSGLPQTLIAPIEAFMQRGVLLVGAYLVVMNAGAVSPGSLIAFMLLSARIAQPLSNLARLIEGIEEVKTAAAMAGSVLNRTPETADPASGLRPRIAGAVSFARVAYAYPGTPERALDGVSFDIPAGTMLGIVGRSGSGKSTLTRLLQGIGRPLEGQVRIDGIDLRDINLAHLRRNLGVVLQENFLFRGTVTDNILAGRPGLTLADAMRAAELAGAAEFIERMPNGYATCLEENAANISGGQRQRLAIARALVHDPRVLVLDEATSALDPESEAAVNANLAAIGAGRTMVIVSHRLSSLTRCHRILVMERGRVLDIGPHRELLARCDTYRTLWQQQNGAGDVADRPQPALRLRTSFILQGA